MRVLGVIALSVIVFAMPHLAGADPVQTQAVQSPATASATSTTATGSATTSSSPAGVRETVKVTAPRTADSLDEIVCKSEPPKTGSRIGGSRECHTARDWKVRQQQSQDVLAHNQSLGMQQPLR
jgi:hypothetical protein